MIRQAAACCAVLAACPLFVAGPALGGEWADEIAVTQDPILQYGSQIAVAPDDTLYVLYLDWTDWEDTQVVLMSSPDKGDTWVGPTTIFSGAAYDNVAIAADADGVHVLLVEFFETPEAEYMWLYYTKSIDGGVTFSEPVRIGEGDNIMAVRIFSMPGYLCIYAQNSDWEVGIDFNYLYVSDDGGDTWIGKRVLPDTAVHHPSFDVRDGVIHVAFGGFLVGSAIHYAYSVDVGDTWSAPVPVSHDEGPHSQLPCIAVDDTYIHVAWEDDRTDHLNISYTRSADGLAWSGDVQLNDTYYGARVKLMTDEEGLHAVWCQYHGDDGWPSSWSSADYGIIWYKFSDDSGQTFSEEFRVSQNEYIDPINLPDMGANYVKLAEYFTGFCALWQDKRDGNVDLYLSNNLLSACPADLNGDGTVDVLDLLAVIAAWGNPGGPEDINGDGTVDVLDLLAVIADWGPC